MHPLRLVAFAAIVAATTPVCAQAQMTAEDLNRMELNRLLQAQQPSRIAPPVAPPSVFIADPVGLIVADRARYQPPSFPGLGTLVGLGIVGAGSVINTLVMGGPL